MSASPRELPFRGARWWKFDFHTHTPASEDWNGRVRSSLPTPREWLLAYMAAEVDCVAVTDHNSGEWIDRIHEALIELDSQKPPGYRPLCLFPGVEISVNSGYHILGILDPSKRSEDVSRLLGACGYTGRPGYTDDVTDRSCLDVITEIERSGIAIPAHVDEPCGLLQVVNAAGGNNGHLSIKKILESKVLVAMERVSTGSRLAPVYEEVGHKLTELVGSDSHRLQGVDIPGRRYTWIKMSEPNLAGLRLALLDGDGSVMRFDDPRSAALNSLPPYFIEGISIEDARYMGRGSATELVFHPGLTTLVGGRGSGKSSVVHSIRLATRKDAELTRSSSRSEASRTFNEFRVAPKSRQDPSGALDYEASKSTKIELRMRREGRLYGLQWLQNGNALNLFDLSGDEQASLPDGSFSPDRFPVTIMSQGQIASLASETQESLLPLLDNAAGIAGLREQLGNSRNEFLALRAREREIRAKLDKQPAIQGKLDDVLARIEQFESRQHADVLKLYQRRNRQIREVSRQIEGAQEHAEKIKALSASVLAESPAPGLFQEDDPIDQIGLGIIQRVQQAIDAARMYLEQAEDALRTAAGAEQTGLGSSEFSVAVAEAITNYKNLANDLKLAGLGDPNQYADLVKSRQQLEDELAVLRSLADQAANLEKDIDASLAKISEVRKQITAARVRFLEEHLTQNPYVRIRVEQFGPRSSVWERQIRDLLNITDGRFEADLWETRGNTEAGLIPTVLLITGESDDPEPTAKAVFALKRALLNGTRGQGNGLGGHFLNYLKREAEKQPEFRDRIEAWFPEDGLVVEYSPQGDGRSFRPIEQGSAGQRAAAMLAFLLAFGAEPLILDQPEDDLDNHLIYDLIVRQIRANKPRRQLIVVTHNANIVVNGDAELVHVMDFRAGQCRVATSGYLQDREVREEVCKVMEGGREAFDRRYRRLQEGRAHV
ncbi:TrlF family AAA-like ATPase [Bryobacter aggregatus]|uniref:TrlF family AAA-like ATPase n=1 Tax=Bryobacter aggregatus TaxID=360054 RepID=UPI0004E1F0A9|nr:AAA family ATPase [Bryobacter aggregatus]